jgi:arylsulfatase A-like enzyme
VSLLIRRWKRLPENSICVSSLGSVPRVGQTDRAIKFLQDAAHEHEPFALFLSWGPPHNPWSRDNVNPQYAELYRDVNLPLAPNYSTISDLHADDWQKLPPDYDRTVHDEMKAYYAQTANLDWNLGRLMKMLDEHGLADNTILVFTSDHGEMFGSHGRHGKLIFYEEAARIPSLGSEKIRAKSVSDALLGTPDIMPTLLSMLGISIPSTVEGSDLSRTILNGSGPDHDAAHMQGMGATAAWADGSEWRALRYHEYMYAIYRRDHSELLFNHRKDPYQLVNLADDRSFATTLTHYRKMSERWRKQQGDTFEACTWYQRWTEDRNIVNTATGVHQDLHELKAIMEKWLPESVGDRSVADTPVGS